MNSKYINNFKIWESLSSLPEETTPEQFCLEVGIRKEDAKAWTNWWKENNEWIKIYYFNFKCVQPILGGVIDKDKIAINRKLNFPNHVKLFLTIHESAHLKQEKEGRFSPYFDTVANGDIEGFRKVYRELEVEANDIAFDAFQEMGIFNHQFRQEERMLRGNENASDVVYRMMTDDIKKHQAVDMFDLIRKQIL